MIDQVTFLMDVTRINLAVKIADMSLSDIKLLDLIIISGGLNALILLIILISLKKPLKKAGTYLGVFIFGYFLNLFNWTIFPWMSASNNWFIPWIPVIFFLPYLLYFFFNTLNGEKISAWKHVLLLVPGVFDIGFQSFRYYLMIDEDGWNYQFMMNRGSTFFIYDGLAILFSCICFVMILSMFRSGRKELQTKHKFYLHMLLFLSYMLFRWLLFFLADVFIPELLAYSFFKVAWFIEMTGLLVIGYHAFIHSRKYLNKVVISTASEKLKDYGKDLLSLLDKKQLFLKPDLTRRNLADELGITESEVSHILKHDLKTTFYKLINEQRVQKAVDLIETGMAETFTLETIAKKAGFKSTTTFNKSFKDIMEMTPNSFRKKQSS